MTDPFASGDNYCTPYSKYRFGFSLVGLFYGNPVNRFSMVNTSFPFLEGRQIIPTEKRHRVLGGFGGIQDLSAGALIWGTAFAFGPLSL